MMRALTATVAVCTRNRPDDLAACLDSLRRLDRVPEAIMVSDQSDPVPAERVRALCGQAISYMAVAPRGLGYSRCEVLARVETDILAFTDDDCVVRPGWLAAILATFERHPEAGAVVGALRPDPNRTLPPDLPEWVSTWGGEVEVVQRGVRDPVGMGGGLNMSFRTEAIRAVGGFDPRLGPGGPLRNADDMDALWKVLRSGRAIVYAPGAVVSHRPPRDLAAHERNEREYALGLGAWVEARIEAGDTIPMRYWRSTLRRTLVLMVRRAPFEGARRCVQRGRIAWHLVLGRRLGRRVLRAERVSA